MQNNPHSHGLWEVSAPPAPATQPLREEVRADVVIVGGGFTGCSAALHLAQQGVRVILLEAVEIGFGGAGRNVGLVNAGMWVMPEALPAVLGPVYGERLLEVLGNAPALVFSLIAQHAIACEPTRTGTLHCAVGAKGLVEIEQRAVQWQARGAAVSVLDAAQSAEKIGTTAYRGALLDLRAGTVQPLAYVRGLAAAAQRAGAQLFTQSAVSAASPVGNGWRVKTEGGSVHADWVIVATDAYTNAPWPQIRTQQVGLPYFQFATQPLSQAQQRKILPERQGAWDTKDVLTSFRFDQTGRLVFGSVGALRRGGAAIHRAWAMRALHRLFPDIGPVAFDMEWYGMIGMTADNLPRFHRLGPNVVGICGYNGRGIAPGTVFGKLLADYVTGQCSTDDMPLPVTDPMTVPFRVVREAGYEFGAQLVHLVEAR